MLIRKLSSALGALLNRLLDFAQPSDTSADLREVPAAFWHHACDGLLVPRDDDFFAASDAVQEFAESGLGFEFLWLFLIRFPELSSQGRGEPVGAPRSHR